MIKTPARKRAAKLFPGGASKTKPSSPSKLGRENPFLVSSSPDKENVTSPIKNRSRKIERDQDVTENGNGVGNGERIRSSRSTRNNLAESSENHQNSSVLGSSVSGKSVKADKNGKASHDLKKNLKDKKAPDSSIASNVSRSTRAKADKDSIIKPKNPFTNDKKEVKKVEKVVEEEEVVMEEDKEDEDDESDEDEEGAGEMEIVIEIQEPENRSSSRLSKSKSKIQVDDQVASSSIDDIGFKSKSKSRSQSKPQASSAQHGSSSSDPPSSSSSGSKGNKQVADKSSVVRKLNESQLSVSREDEVHEEEIPIQSTPFKPKSGASQEVVDDEDEEEDGSDEIESGDLVEVEDEDEGGDEDEEEDQEVTQMPEKIKNSSSPKKASKSQDQDESGESDDSEEAYEDEEVIESKGVGNAEVSKINPSKEDEESSDSEEDEEADSEEEYEVEKDKSVVVQKQHESKYKSSFMRKSQAQVKEEKTKTMVVDEMDEDDDDDDDEEKENLAKGKQNRVEVKSSLINASKTIPSSSSGPSGRTGPSKFQPQEASKGIKRKSEEPEEENPSSSSGHSSSKALRSDDGVKPLDEKKVANAPQTSRSGISEIQKKLEAFKNAKPPPPKVTSNPIEKVSNPSSAQTQVKKTFAPNSPGSSIPISTTTRSSPNKNRSQINTNFKSINGSASSPRPIIPRSDSTVSYLREQFEGKGSPNKVTSPTLISNGSTTPANSPLPSSRNLGASSNVGSRGLYPSLASSLAIGNKNAGLEKEKKVEEEEKDLKGKGKASETEVLLEKETEKVDEDSEMEDVQESPISKVSNVESEKEEFKDARPSPLASPLEEKEAAVIVSEKEAEVKEVAQDEEEEEDMIMATEIDNLEDVDADESEEEEAEDESDAEEDLGDDKEMVLEELSKKQTGPTNTKSTSQSNVPSSSASPSKASGSQPKDRVIAGRPAPKPSSNSSDPLPSANGTGFFDKIKMPFSGMFGGKPQQPAIPGQSVPRHRIQPPGSSGFVPIPKNKIPGSGNGPQPPPQHSQSRMGSMSQAPGQSSVGGNGPPGSSSQQQRPALPASFAPKPSNQMGPKQDANRNKGQQFDADRRAAEKAKSESMKKKPNVGVNLTVGASGLKAKMKVKPQEKEREVEDEKNGKRRKLSHESEVRNGNGNGNGNGGQKIQNPNQQSNRPAQHNPLSSSVNKASGSQKPMPPISGIPRSNTVNPNVHPSSSGFNPATQPIVFDQQQHHHQQKPSATAGPSNSKLQVPGKAQQPIAGSSKNGSTFSNHNHFQPPTNSGAQALANSKQQQMIMKQKQLEQQLQQQKYQAKEEEAVEIDDDEGDPNATLPEIVSE